MHPDLVIFQLRATWRANYASALHAIVSSYLVRAVDLYTRYSANRIPTADSGRTHMLPHAAPIFMLRSLLSASLSHNILSSSRVCSRLCGRLPFLKKTSFSTMGAGTMTVDTSQRLAALRQLLDRHSPKIDAFVVPSEDARMMLACWSAQALFLTTSELQTLVNILLMRTNVALSSPASMDRQVMQIGQVWQSISLILI